VAYSAISGKVQGASNWSTMCLLLHLWVLHEFSISTLVHPTTITSHSFLLQPLHSQDKAWDTLAPTLGTCLPPHRLPQHVYRRRVKSLHRQTTELLLPARLAITHTHFRVVITPYLYLLMGATMTWSRVCLHLVSTCLS